MAKQYRARDRTVQRMGRDGLEEVNLHTQESRRISKKVAENGRLGKRTADGDVLLDGGFRAGKRRRGRRRHRRGEGDFGGGEGMRADRKYPVDGRQDIPQGLAPQAVRRPTSLRSARNDRAGIRSAQDDSRGLCSVWKDKKENRSAQDDNRGLNPGGDDGGGNNAYQEPLPLREYPARIREFAASDAGHRHYGRIKSYAYGKQGRKTDGEKSAYAIRNKVAKGPAGASGKRPEGKKRLKRDRRKKDKLLHFKDASAEIADAGYNLTGDGEEHSEQAQTDGTVQEMHEHLAYAGRDMSYRLYHGLEKSSAYFLSKLRNDAAENPRSRTSMRNRRQTDVKAAPSRREPVQNDVSSILRNRQESSALRNDRNETAPVRTDAFFRKQKNRRMQKTIQKRKYQKAYVEAVSNGIPATSIIDRMKSVTGLQGNILSAVNHERQQGILVTGAVKNKAAGAAAIILSCVVLLLSVLSFAGIIFDSGLMAIAATTYQSTDEEIHSAEDAYLALEDALDTQINEMESTHPGYDEYRYQVDEIAHNPFQLISYLTVLYGEFTIADVEDVLRELFDEQYTLLVWEEVETRTRTVTDPDTGEEMEEEYGYYILNISLTNRGFDTVARERMTEDQTKLYEVYNSTFGNRQYLFDETTIPDSGVTGGGTGYDIPPEALSDERFARMVNEAEKYLGYPYVWGGSSPSTSFDCSGFVSWVINNSGNGWNVGRQTANGLRGLCTYVSPEDAKPGDLIFFQGTYNTAGASHVGIYVGNGTMIHCGSPIQYSNIQTNYWQSHFMSFGRLP